MEIKLENVLSHSIDRFIDRSKSRNFCLFDYSLFVISPEDEVVATPCKEQEIWAGNYWKYL